MSNDINTSDAQPGDVLISLTFPRGQGNAPTATLSIREQISGETLIRVDLTAEEFTSIMASGGTYVSGAYVTRNPQRIGRRVENTSTEIRYGADDGAEQVKANYLAAGWERVRIDRTNFGHRVVAYRWINDTEA